MSTRKVPVSCHRAVEMRGRGKGIPGLEISQSLSNGVGFQLLTDCGPN